MSCRFIIGKNGALCLKNKMVIYLLTVSAAVADLAALLLIDSKCCFFAAILAFSSVLVLGRTRVFAVPEVAAFFCLEVLAPSWAEAIEPKQKTVTKKSYEFFKLPNFNFYKQLGSINCRLSYLKIQLF